MPKLLTLCPMATWTVRKSNPVNTANINQMPPLFWQGRHFIFGASPHNSRLTAQAPLRRLWHGICVAKMLNNVGLRYPHRASGAKAPRTLRPLPLLRFAVSATGGAHLCSIQYYLRFWFGICRTSLAVSALRIMRYCPNKRSLQSSKVNLQRALVCIKAENCIISRYVLKVRIIGQAMIYNRSIEGNGSLPK